MGVVDLIAAWLKDVKAHAMRLLQQGVAVGEWKLVQGRSNRKWTASDELIAKVLTQNGLEEDSIWKKKLTTPAKVEKAVGKKNFKDIAEWVHKPPGKPKLAPGSDKRPALSLDALTEFGDLGEDGEAEDDE